MNRKKKGLASDTVIIIAFLVATVVLFLVIREILKNV